MGCWSVLGLVKGEDARKVAELEDIEGDDDIELEWGWDRIELLD